jgi:uridine phosphorylase
MLIAEWITERLAEGVMGFELLSAAIVARAAERGLETTAREVRVILERLIRDGKVETCQYLAEDDRYEPTVYDKSNIYFYAFRVKSAIRRRP